MSSFKNFAIVGAGNLGSFILDELLKVKTAGGIDKVVVLTRPDSVGKLDSYASNGAIVVPIPDYNDVSTVSEALKGVDVLISTLGHAAATQLQVPIAEAARSAGVKLFVPSEFGSSTDGAKQGHLAMKLELTEKLATIMPVTKFFNGNLADWMWMPMVHLDVKSGKVAVGGDGNAKMSFTSRPDIARYVVHVLTTLAPEETVNKTFRIESQRLSFNEIFEVYEQRTGTKLEIKYIPIDELQENIRKDPRDFGSMLHLAWASGAGTVGDSSALDNAMFPEWNPTPVIDYL
ncbi:NAD-P-binding protein [Peniophora sp. CONT]|nr:NAD-P-binding protein [Peniophora sp. CONT]